MARINALQLGLTIVFVGAPLATLAQGPQDGTTSASASTRISSKDEHQNDPVRPGLHERYPRYQVQRDDKLSLSFPLSSEFNQTLTIQPDGYVSLYGGPSIHIQGMTVPEVVEAIKKAYSGTLHDPIINVDLLDFQRAYFTVSGQVGRPGQYDLRRDTTVTEAIGVAGGFTPQAKTQVFLFHRVSTGWFEVKQLKLNDILNGKSANEDSTLGPGDMIFVPEKFITKFRKYVPYSVGLGVYPSVPAL